MIARWIRETILEYQKAKNNLNYLKMAQMTYLEEALKDLREKAQKFR